MTTQNPGNIESRIVDSMRRRQYSLGTERSYISWYKRFVRFHGLRHPAEMGTEEVNAFLTHLARNLTVAKSTQNQALNALVFLYRHVLDTSLEGISALRAKERRRIPVVLTTEEMGRILQRIATDWRLHCALIYGCGLRLMECMRLRIKDADEHVVRIHGAKGGKSRVLSLPESLRPALARQIKRSRRCYDLDRSNETPGVELPCAIARKSPGASTSWPWFWLFPSSRHSIDPRSGIRRRHHAHEAGFTRTLKEAVRLLRDRQERLRPYASSQLCNPPPSRRRRSAFDSGGPRTLQHQDH